MGFACSKPWGMVSGGHTMREAGLASLFLGAGIRFLCGWAPCRCFLQ